MRKIILYCIAAVFTIAIFSGCSQKKQEEVFTGSIEAKTFNVQSEVAGQVLELQAEEGAVVHKGQVIARLEDKDLKIKLQEAQANLKLAQSKLAEAKAGTRAAQVHEAQAQLKQIRATMEGIKNNLHTEQKTLQDYQTLLANEAINEKQVAAQQSKVDSLEAQYNSLQAQIEAAQARLKLLQEGATTYTLEQLQAMEEQAATGVDQARYFLSKTVLKVPADGVIQRKVAEAGELVTAGSTIATIIDPQDLWVKIYVPENKINLVSLQQKVLIEADAYPQEKFQGKIIQIAQEAEFTPKNVQTKEDRVKLVFAVKVKITSGQDKLKAGLPVDVYLTKAGK
ncbi:HlyD family efflux transporter periplasmic adaptor subunit [Bacillota bacterium LX-D]|nr:HlyD family efflux transporter periplasmic adaptor subunit [Bacillota bacterium LX-D]